MDTILQIDELHKKMGKFQLSDLSFRLDAGYIMGFIGPNGSGKTSTIKLIMNLIKKDKGSIMVFGQDMENNEKQIKDRIGFVYDQCNYYDTLKIRDNAKLVAPFYSRWDWSVFEDYLKRFELDPNQKVMALSKGMKVKFQLAIALSHDAELLIMDEPTSGLDPIFRSELLGILKEYIEGGRRSVLFSTHITADLEKSADFITFIHNGKMVFSMEKDEVLSSYAIVKGGLDVLDEGLKRELIGVRKYRFGFEGMTRNPSYILEQYKESILLEKATLEEVMLYVAGGNV